jgi:hypothetical protein
LPIRSLACFQSVIAESQQQPIPDSYSTHLRLKLQRAEAALSTHIQKSTSSAMITNIQPLEQLNPNQGTYVLHRKK